MDVLVIGGGGREHALVWKIGQSPSVEQIYCAPGNPGMRGTTPVDLVDSAELADFAADKGIALTVVGPEAPLCAGIVDVFRARGLRIVGPDRRAAQLEGSKSYAKAFMEKYGMPTANGETFTDPDGALACVRRRGAPVVVKADGLAAGKGVVVAETEQEALAAVEDCFSGRFGEAGQKVLVEDCLFGEEASILALTDGKTVLPLASSQDHKRVGEGDTGPNTGGMGAYSPAPVVTDALWEQVKPGVLDRFLKGCQCEGLDYRGVIYAGIMVTDDGPKVLEFNVRFGDPETQAILVRLNSDLADALAATADGRLSEIQLEWSVEPAVCVAMASGGYPGSYEKGRVITGIEDAEALGAVVFHAGTARQGNTLVTAGGRVLGVTAKGVTIEEAIRNVYKSVDRIRWDGAYYRKDIAHRAIARRDG